jgi:hypothetical protein
VSSIKEIKNNTKTLSLIKPGIKGSMIAVIPILIKKISGCSVNICNTFKFENKLREIRK